MLIPNACPDVDMISDVTVLSDKILEQVSIIDDLCQKLGKLQSKICGGMKRSLQRIKEITQKLSLRMSADSPAEKIRETYKAVVSHNGRLSTEVARLRESLANKKKDESINPALLPQRTPRIILIEKISFKNDLHNLLIARAQRSSAKNDEANISEVHMKKDEMQMSRNATKEIMINKSGLSFPRLSDDVIIERITTRMLALQRAETKKGNTTKTEIPTQRHK